MITKMEPGSYYKINDDKKVEARNRLLEDEYSRLSEDKALEIALGIIGQKYDKMSEDDLQALYKLRFDEDIEIITGTLTKEEIMDLVEKGKDQDDTDA